MGQRAQKISDGWEARRLHGKLDEFARRFCPIFKHFGVVYHWSIDQAEYATDVVFKRQADLSAIYDNLTRTAIHTIVQFRGILKSRRRQRSLGWRRRRPRGIWKSNHTVSQPTTRRLFHDRTRIESSAGADITGMPPRGTRAG